MYWGVCLGARVRGAIVRGGANVRTRADTSITVVAQRLSTECNCADEHYHAGQLASSTEARCPPSLIPT